MARILVAEDDVFIRQLVNMWLTRGGYEVILVHNGREAIDYLEKQDADLLISDVSMPLLSGVELVEWWRNQHHSPKPVILLSCTYRKEELESRMQPLNVHFVTKPFSPTRLMKIVEGLVNQAGVGMAGKVDNQQ